MKGRKIIINLTILPIIFLVISCTQETDRSSMLPNITGTAGEVVLVIESYHWQSELGEEFKKTLQKGEVALPGPEPMFDLIYVPPSAFTSVFKTHRNIIMVKISPDFPEAKLLIQKDLYAKSQLVINAVGKNAGEILNYLSENGERVRSIILGIERKRITDYYKKYEEKDIRDKLIEDHKIGLFIPKGYKLDVNEDNFVWISHETPDVDQQIFVYHYDYVEGNTFTPEYLINKRNEVLKKYVPGPVDNSYATTEPAFEPIFTEVRYKERYFAQLRGLWRVEGYIMGGPFISFTTLDEKRNKIITVEGMVFAPREKKRNYLRQLEGILYTLYIPE